MDHATFQVTRAIPVTPIRPHFNGVDAHCQQFALLGWWRSRLEQSAMQCSNQVVSYALDPHDN
jgi:hypothetical protein